MTVGLKRRDGGAISPCKRGYCGEIYNKSFFLNVELLDEAIEQRKKVCFTYLEYDINKRYVPRREEKYTVEPYEIVYHNERCYLVCCMDGKSKTSMYRIDRMRDVELTDCPPDEHEPGFDPRKEAEAAVYAFAGESETIALLCDRFVIGEVIDKFGKDVHLRQTEDGRAEARFRAAPQGVKFWALQYLPYVEVTEPAWLRGEIMESIRNNRYVKDGGQKE